MSILVNGHLPTTFTKVQNECVELVGLNLDAMEQSPSLKDTIIKQLQDVFHVEFHGTLVANCKQEVDFLQFYVFNPSPTTTCATHLMHPTLQSFTKTPTLSLGLCPLGH